MKRFFLTLAATAIIVGAQSQPKSSNQTNAGTEQDSLRHYDVELIEVVATRAQKSTPVAHSNISKEQILKNSYALDIPSLLAMTPSLVATNETGIGIGGTSIRLRGTDATRVNVTLHGMSLNNPASHSTYWYDTPDLISAIGDVQVQRGAGTSTNGTCAFGGAISMTTAAPATDFEGDVSLSYGS